MFTIKDISISDKIISVEVMKEKAELFAAYLYRNNVCVEKKMYVKDNIISFDFDIQAGGCFYIKAFRKYGSEVLKIDSDLFYVENSKLKKPNKKILSEERDFLIESYEQGSEIVFVTFNGTKTDKKSRPFGAEFILQSGWDLICVFQDNDTQYQSLSEQQFFSAVAKFIEGKKVYTYGSSLGGYCAVYYGGIINATIIAASPKNSAHPSICIPRFKNLEFKHSDINRTSKTDKAVYIIYDPSITADTKFISNQIRPHYSDVQLLPVAFGSHMVLTRVLELKMLKKLVYSIIEGNFFEVSNRIITLNHKESSKIACTG